MKSRVSRATVAIGAVIMLLVAATPVQAEWNKGLEAYKNKDWATAVKEFEEVTKTNPDYAGAYYMLGVSQRALGQLSPAIANLRKAVELDGESNRAVEHDVMIHRRRDDLLVPAAEGSHDVWRILEHEPEGPTLDEQPAPHALSDLMCSTEPRWRRVLVERWSRALQREPGR